MTKPRNKSLDLPRAMMEELETVKTALPEETFYGRVPDRGPRKTWGGVIRWMMDTHPEVIKLLGKQRDSGDETKCTN